VYRRDAYLGAANAIAVREMTAATRMRNPATHPATLVGYPSAPISTSLSGFSAATRSWPTSQTESPNVVTTGPEGTVYSPTRLAVTIRARDRLSVAWDEWADANGIPTNDYDERGKWEAVNAATYVGAYADAVAAWDRLDRTGWQADFLDDYRRAATSVR